jgi:hypothetical protein
MLSLLYKRLDATQPTQSSKARQKLLDGRLFSSKAPIKSSTANGQVPMVAF